MTTGTQTQTATIYQFPLGGRTGAKTRALFWQDDSASKPLENEVHFDWRATYHDAAIADETGRN